MDQEFRQLQLRQEDTRLQLEQLKATFDRQKPLFDATIKFAEIAIRSLLLLNGGAVLALLTLTSRFCCTLICHCYISLRYRCLLRWALQC